MFYYLVTLKDNKDRYISQRELYTQLQHVVRDYMPKGTDWSTCIAYELDTRSCLHLHTIVLTKNRISYKKISQAFSEKYNMHLHFKMFPKKDLQNVYDYICKEPRPYTTLEQISRERLYYKPTIFDVRKLSSQIVHC